MAHRELPATDLIRRLGAWTSNVIVFWAPQGAQYGESELCYKLSSLITSTPNCPLRKAKYHLIETIRPLIEVHWGV